MKHLKTFENYIFEYQTVPGTGQILDYDVDDTVVCTRGANDRKTSKPLLIEGEEYKVIKIYQIPEDKFLHNPFLRVDVEDSNGVITKGWESTRFKIDLEFDAGAFGM